MCKHLIFYSKILSFLSLVVIQSQVVAQNSWRIEGTVLNQKTQQPIPYVSIGILNTNVGTVSTIKGHFAIRIPTSNSQKMLTFYMFGYEQKHIPIEKLKQQSSLKIELTEKPITLPEIKISGRKKFITRHLGVKRSQAGTGVYHGDVEATGAAIALKLTNPGVPVQVKKVRLKIFKNKLTEFKVRVRFFEVDPHTGKPGKDLWPGNLVFASKQKRGWMNIDLSNKNIWIDRSAFFLAFEWIEEQKALRDKPTIQQMYENNKRRAKMTQREINGVKVTGVRVKGKIRGNMNVTTLFGATIRKPKGMECYARKSSLGKWKKQFLLVAGYATILY